MGAFRLYKNITLALVLLSLISLIPIIEANNQLMKIGLATNLTDCVFSINQGTYFLEINLSKETMAINPGTFLPVSVSNRLESTYSIMIGAFPFIGLTPTESNNEALRALSKIRELGFNGTIIAFNMIPGYIIEIGRFFDLLEAELFRLKIAEFFPEATILPTIKKGILINISDFEVLFPTMDNQALGNILSLKPFGSSMINFKQKVYRGAINIIWSSNQELFNVINEIYIEEYLLGVVPSEMPDSFNLEALKTQAITARTYALKNKDRFKKEGFDLCDTSMSQVYGGFLAEKTKSTQAVNDTFGIILNFQGELANTFYHSTSGGLTENIENVWGGNPVPYLVSVESPYESGSPYYEWVRIFSASETSTRINNLLKDRGLSSIGNVINIQVTRRGFSPRILSAKIIGDKNTVEVSGSFLKSAFNLRETWAYFEFDGGPGKLVSIIGRDEKIYERTLGEVLNPSQQSSLNSIIIRGRSTETKIPLSWQNLTIKGRGWGHGVGMSQWGAQGMAQAGWNYVRILNHFYPGTTLIKIY